MSCVSLQLPDIYEAGGMPAAGGLQWPSSLCLPAGNHSYLKNNNKKKKQLHLWPSGSCRPRWGEAAPLGSVAVGWGTQVGKVPHPAPSHQLSPPTPHPSAPGWGWIAKDLLHGCVEDPAFREMLFTYFISILRKLPVCFPVSPCVK